MGRNFLSSWHASHMSYPGDALQAANECFVMWECWLTRWRKVWKVACNNDWDLYFGNMNCHHTPVKFNLSIIHNWVIRFSLSPEIARWFGSSVKDASELLNLINSGVLGNNERLWTDTCVLEEYKRATATNLRKTKGLHKDLQNVESH